MRPIKLLIVALLLAQVTMVLGETDPPRPTQQRIRVLIQQLGADGYLRRKIAESELGYLGHEAIDELLEAQYKESPEISLAARQLLGRLVVAWTRPDDPPITNEILRGYQQMPPDLRAARADWLAKLEDGAGFQAVARIVRYEPSEFLAKKAAIALMQSIDRQDEQHVRALKTAIDSTLGESTRQPAKWLHALLADLTVPDGTTVQAWEKLAEKERGFERGLRSTNEMTATIYQALADQALRHNDAKLAKTAIEELIELRKDDGAEILATCYWLLDKGQEPIFRELISSRFDQYKKRLPQFLYCDAEALLERDERKSEELAEQAFELTDDASTFGDPVATSFVRFNAAIALENRGHTEWAIREYRRLSATDSRHWRIEMVKEQATIVLSELLHDRGRDEEAADALAELIGDEAVAVFAEDSGDDETASIVSRMYYFRSEHHRQHADREKQIEFLRKAIKADPTDADVLIAMYRLPRTDKKWKEDTQANIRSAVKLFERKLQRSTAAGEIDNRFEIAKHLNQIAWLVSNTEGELAKAVQQSRRSLELRPRSPGSLDTLGRSYYSVGDIDNALKYQRRAVKMEPHSRQIARQLAEFETAASQSAQP